MDKEKILMGLVEDHGKWVTIEEKLKIEKERTSTPAGATDPTVIINVAPVLSNTEPKPAATKPTKNDLPIPTIFPQTIEIKKPDEVEQESQEGSYADYVLEQKRKNRILLFGVLIIAIIAGLLISYLMLPGK